MPPWLVPYAWNLPAPSTTSPLVAIALPVREQGAGPAGAVAIVGQPGLLSDEHFVDEMQTRLPQADRDLAEIPRHQRPGRARPLADYMSADRARDAAIARAMPRAVAA